MRALLLFILMPFLAFSGNVERIDVSYSIQGESVIMTWTDVPEASKYVVKSGSETNKAGDIKYTVLKEIEQNGQFQWTYSDKREKPRTIVYYKIVGLNKENEVVSEASFSANFVNKDYYTVNVTPNYFSKILDLEINSKTSGPALVSVEDLTGSYKMKQRQFLNQGYNNFSIDVKGANANRLVVKIDHNDKIVYRMVEVEGTSPQIITSDE